MQTIDTSFLYKPTPELPGEKFNNEGWGYLDVNNLDVLDAFDSINDIVDPHHVVEIGMFAGHSTVMMLEKFHNLESIASYDPNHVSAISAEEIEARYPQFTFYKEAIWGNEDRHEDQDIDLIFVDGDHGTSSVLKDIKSCLDIQPRYILFDNVEHSGVSAALNRVKLYNKKYSPQYFFYTNHHKDNVKPGILLLVKMEDLTIEDWLELDKQLLLNA